MDHLKNLVKSHRYFIVYFLISVFITILDVITSFSLENLLRTYFPDFSGAALTGNAVGVIVGFVVQYILCTRKIYAGSSLKTIVIFFLTWILNIGMAEGIIYFIRTIVFQNKDGVLYFLTGKCVSIVIPFFITYFLRKRFIPTKKQAST